MLNQYNSRLSTHHKYAINQNDAADDDNDDDEDLDEEEDDVAGPKFKVIIENAQPAGVKISKKNTCIVEIINHELEKKKDDEHVQLIQYFIDQKKPTWGSQFM